MMRPVVKPGLPRVQGRGARHGLQSRAGVITLRFEFTHPLSTQLLRGARNGTPGRSVGRQGRAGAPPPRCRQTVDPSGLWPRRHALGTKFADLEELAVQLGQAISENM